MAIWHVYISIHCINTALSVYRILYHIQVFPSSQHSLISRDSNMFQRETILPFVLFLFYFCYKDGNTRQTPTFGLIWSNCLAAKAKLTWFPYARMRCACHSEWRHHQYGRQKCERTVLVWLSQVKTAKLDPHSQAIERNAITRYHNDSVCINALPLISNLYSTINA